MNGANSATIWWDRRADYDYVSENDMEDTAWGCFIEEAAEYEPFNDEDGEWLEGFPDKLGDTKEWAEYCNEFRNELESIQEACREWEACGRDMYVYYGVSRSDFA
tara:strand:+ start:2005 stop:2319 length:315 start_codon:yes stop_codon:yes gene_type:complete